MSDEGHIASIPRAGAPDRLCAISAEGILKMEGTMRTNKSVLIIGFDPKFLDFSSPELAPLNLTAEKVRAGTATELERLRSLGYEPDGCFVDLGDTAEAAVASRLRAKEYGCVVIGAGVRANPKFFLLFEKLLNVVHEFAPKSRIGFNTNPTDTGEAVQRWL